MGKIRYFATTGAEWGFCRPWPWRGPPTAHGGPRVPPRGRILNAHIPVVKSPTFFDLATPLWDQTLFLTKKSGLF